MNIREALAQMDSMDDDQWTGDGLPKVDFVSGLMGKNVTRKEITDAAPHFSRSNMETIDADGTKTETTIQETGEEAVFGNGTTEGVAVPKTDVVAGVVDEELQPTDSEGARTDLVEDQKNETVVEDVEGGSTNLTDTVKTETVTQDVNGNETDLLDGDKVKGDAGVLTDDVNNKSEQQPPISHPNHDHIQPSDDPENEGTFDEFLADRPVAPNQFSRFLNSVETEDLKELKAGLEEQLSDLRSRKADLEEDEQNIRQALGLVKMRVSREVPDISDAEANRAYLNSQHQARLQKKQASDQLLRGVDKDSLDPRAPIDRAMGLSRGHGKKRPNYFTKR